MSENRSLNILLVDDEPIVREVMADFLTIIGHHVDEVDDGLSGLQAIRAGAYDVVFTDIRMPGIDGIEFLKQVKAIFPNLPIIVITGHGSEDTEREAIAAGATGYLNKPIAFTDARRIIEEIFPYNERKDP